MKLKIKNNKGKMVLSVISAVLAVVFISLSVIQFKSVEKYQKSDVKGLRDDELKTQIASYQSKYNEAEAQYEDNLNKINEYKKSTDDDNSTIIDEEVTEAKTILGLTEVTGKGVIITLTDTNDAQYTSENLRTLVNELKYAGAEAISINDNRIVNLTDIVTINNSYIVMYGDVRISSPYIVKAIGDTSYLTSTLNMKNSGFVDLMKSSGLEISVEESNNIVIPKYSKEMSTKYMKEEN